MKKKSLLVLPLSLALTAGLLAGCGGTGSKEITVWVGNESTEFYKKVCAEYKEAHPEFGYDIKVVGSDSGTNGGAMVQDNTACGDIVTIAHDNIGKLSQLSYIQPITDEGLLAQIEEDNPESFKTVIKNKLGTSEDRYTFAVPYISQALFLYYDTRYLSEEDVVSFEALEAAAKKVSPTTKSYTVVGMDGFNFSFTVLARRMPENTSNLRLYENEVRYDTYFQSNEQVAVSRWAQESFNNPNGGMLPTDSGWAVDLKSHKVLSVIGGAWKYNEFKSSVTDSDGVHMGCALIPTFKVTQANVEGLDEIPASESPTGKVDPAIPAGTEFRGGTFADCKCFVLNMAADPAKYNSLVALTKYLSSKDIQKRSFIEALNVPAFKDAGEFIESSKTSVDESVYKMAKAQTGMAQYGIPQPFVNGTLNTFYYQDSAPDYLKEAIANVTGNFSTADAMRALHFKMEYVWKHGNLPTKYPESYPHDTDAKQ